MAKKVQELVCWQRADALRQEVIAICAQDHVSRHLKFCDGFTDAAGSVCRNISEGFGRGSSAQIVQFFNYALASLREAEDYLREALLRQFIEQSRFDALVELAEHTRATTLKFSRHHETRMQAGSRTTKTRSLRSDEKTNQPRPHTEHAKDRSK